MSLRRSARISSKTQNLQQGTYFKDLIFSFSPALVDGNLEDKVTSNGGKVQKTFTKKVNFLVATKVELAEKKLAAKIKNALDNPDCKVVDESFISDCIRKNQLIDVEEYILKPPSEEDKKTHTPVIPKRKTTRKTTKKEKDEGEDEEDEGEEKKTKGKRKRVTKSEVKSEDEDNKKKKGKKVVKKEDDAMDVDDDKKEEEEEEEEEEVIVKEIRKGRTVVDPNVPNSNDYHVLEEGDEIYDAILNQTNIANNNNKFYNLQVLKKDNSNMYCFWTRWGRVGERGQSKLLNCSSKDMAISNFKSKFRDKTGNSWDDRKNFVKKDKKYFLLERDYGVTEEDEKEMKEQAREAEKMDIPESKLDVKVQDIIKLIFDISLMEQQMSEIGYNAKKMPLGKLTKEHIKKSFAVLKKLDDELNNKKRPSVLSDLTSEFYTIIPHDFGRTRPPVINTSVLLKKKIEMVESLADIQIATTLLKKQTVEITENPIDTNYKSLHCGLVPLDHNSDEFEMITTYVENTHAKTHSWYELEVDEVYVVDREGEKERFLGNKYPEKKRKLLWHGSRLTNFAGILSQGLRIAPPEAPVTGYMFGKGVYFADMVSKSANYCYASSRQIGLMLLCEVMTGEENDLLYADYNADSLAKKNNKDSTKGCGRTAPDPSKSAYTKDGVEVPYGPAIDVKLDKDGSLLYNEYIVYDVAQIKMRYLIKMKFNKPKKN